MTFRSKIDAWITLLSIGAVVACLKCPRNPCPVQALGLVTLFSSAYAQVVDNPELYSDITEGGVGKLTSYLDAAGSPSVSIRVPGMERTVPLLDVAMRAGNEEGVVLLLRAGAYPHDIPQFLELAAHHGFARVIDSLLERDPTLILRMRPESHPLLFAAEQGHSDVVSTLLKRMGEAVGEADRQPVLDEALRVAINNAGSDASRRSIVRALLAAGADAAHTSALAGAVLECAPDLVSMFLAAGADAGRAYDIGRGPVFLPQYAVRCFERDTDIAKRILSELESAGAELCVVDLADSRVPEQARMYLRDVENCD